MTPLGCGLCGRTFDSGALAYLRWSSTGRATVCRRCRPSPGHPRLVSLDSDLADFHAIRASTAVWARPDYEPPPKLCHLEVEELYAAATPSEREILDTIAGTTARTVAEASHLLGIDEQAGEKRRQRLVSRTPRGHSARQSAGPMSGRRGFSREEVKDSTEGRGA